MKIADMTHVLRMIHEDRIGPKPQECSFEREKEKSSNNLESFTLKRGRSVPTVALQSMPNLSRTTLLRQQMIDYEGS